MNPRARSFGGKIKKMAEGGASSSSSSKAPSPQDLEVILARQREMDAKMNKAAADAAARRKAGGYCGGGMAKRVKMASGGSVRGNGCAIKGKTRGRIV